ncbi:sugar transferase [Planktosalinus lacus]|uniref:Glycosyl transferase n=1 Tax=Planktosalinus lacus TaxID=1526573 RepID=A0A8J2Y9D1_9FLAO|nr:sugar transferase [Planktosalinus lacus]GGD98238.1 glycosyl transferase [Planktosalinus lacus]
MLSKRQQLIKRTFDLSIALVGLLVLLIPLFFLILIARIDTGFSGVFSQERVGKEGQIFKMYKIRTLKGTKNHTIEELVLDQTKYGGWLRKTKLDELPQLFNVLKGDMSLVGPRPDIPGYADTLEGEGRIVLKVKPGITGPATIKYKEETKLLLTKENPQAYNDEIIWPDKVKINKAYVKNWTFFNDLKYIFKSIV